MSEGAGDISTTPGATASKEKTVVLSLLCDIGLWLPEIAAVVLSGSVTLFADVMKDGNEILATVFALAILLKMKKGGEFKYDYGMGKFETFTRSATGVVMLVSIIIIFFAAFHRIFVPEPLQTAGAYLAIPLMVISAIIDTYLWKKNYRISLSDPSPIMEAQWRLRRTKSFADIAVLLSLVLSFALIGYSWSTYIDPVISFVIIGFLLIAGFREISSSLPDLFDKTLEEELQIVILHELSAFFTEYEGFYGVRSRRSGSKIYIDIFLGFDPGLRMGEVQATCDRLRAALEQKISGSVVSIVPTSEPAGPAHR
ncbi:cation diffusion facilitator family transporter [Methanoregula boonei 6A8]|jgi:cation diffusion facilitator family transporter|uniref:Cation diffusion facilitator family transporter n=1 Tax=Methanoregula boonei (strain DSM 21154 / JCM 14090 / 6A8) TaxID=456442 RepID=A7IA62_METB6|nr:cation transporter [Methanoregula boonei]ABS56623.1 cation diffusion facilitator family transporter [Methanoregula boonei 6A8]